MTLQDTVSLMLSDDYKERFKAEYYQCKIREEKLNAMLDKCYTGSLSFTPTCNIQLLEKQGSVMRHYLLKLEQRAKIEGIDLTEGGNDV